MEPEYEYGISEGFVLRLPLKTMMLEIYRGNGEWEFYDDYEEWATNTTAVKESEAKEAMKEFDATLATE